MVSPLQHIVYVLHFVEKNSVSIPVMTSICSLKAA